MMASVTGAVAVAVGSAVLAIPDDSSVDLDGKAMIAWNGSAESANALRRAVPLLAGAKSVHLITFGNSHNEFPATEALDYLSQHDIHAELHEYPKEVVVEEAIERVGEAMGASWIVMGAYGHNRIRETLFGGVTRYMLDSAHFPLFLAH
jgi:nucleotide-binding universal stress UspA family protein